jgi:hypothetical protein
MIVPLLAALAAAALLAGGASAGGSAPPGTEISSAGFAEIRRLSREVGLSKDYEDFLVLTAYGESRGNNLVGLGNPARFPPWTRTYERWVEQGRPALTSAQRREAKRAEEGYDARPWLHGCWPRIVYTFGSGGLFAMLPSTALAAYRGTELQCQHPWTVFDAPTSFVMALATIVRLQRWSQWKENPTILALRVGWGLPRNMNDSAVLADRRKRYTEHCKAVGIHPSLLDRRPTPLPTFDPVSLTRAVGGLVWLPGGPDA